MSLLLYVLAVMMMVEGHPTMYPHRAHEASKGSWRQGGVPPGVISYHVHLTYTVFNPDSIKRAMVLREAARAAFKPFLGPDCDGRYDYGYLCMIADHNFNTTLTGGPFVSGEWSIFIPVPYYNLVVPWMFQNRGNFSIVVHPNTGFEYEDHSIWAMWAGQVWALDMTIFDQGQQTNEFGHHRGDSDNPVCLTKGGVCGDSLFGIGPETLCCYGLACSPAESVSPLKGAEVVYRCK